ncbi:vif protein [Simian immunodeficiency virus - agm.tan-1]|uniref:Virion infectivity factor n=1 Tax=Simian immunodeficiency virus AGM.tantalus TaxID=349692 RepID=VIF_SIVTA|nr:RecName: Full=Virion infectivity factor; Short=Vif; AltName: Full=Q protein; AltName: Full=SOR protein [Simian immunodeficiency virus - agm.tan]AAC57053.1 vif protein [Simian immunodeficiency virus - agm.tan-1]
MEREKLWVTRLTWRVSGEHIDKWKGIVKYHMRNRLQDWTYLMHYQCGWAWYTCSRFLIPLGGEGKIVVDCYWHLTPEQGWLSTYAVAISFENWQNTYKTEVTPDVADHMIHCHYFPCFTDRAIQQAIRGESFLWCTYKEGHVAENHWGQVRSLQFLALTVYTDFLRNGRRKRFQGKKTRMVRNLGSQQGAVGRMIKRHGSRTQSGSTTPFWERTPLPSMELLSGRRGKEWGTNDRKGL